MRIGLDIDGVLCNFAEGLSAVALQMYDHQCDLTRYSLGLSDERYLAANDMMIRINLYKQLRPYDHTISIVREWAETHDIYYITRRRSGHDNRLDSKIQDHTLEWLKMHNFPFWWQVAFTQDKLRFCHEQNIPLLIEDYLHDAAKFYGLTRNGESMYCILVDRPWNQGDCLIRVDTLKDAERYLRR